MAQDALWVGSRRRQGHPASLLARLVPSFIARDIYGPAMAGLADESPYDEYAGYYAEAHDHVLDRAMIADQRFHLQSVLSKVHAMSMAHGLEVRVPLLDRSIMDLAGAMDLRLLNPAPKGPPKLVLRKLAERLGVPQTVPAAWKTYGPPRLQAASALRSEQSASTYPVSGFDPGQDGDPR